MMHKTNIHLKSPWAFFIIAFCISWVFWVPAMFIDENILGSSWVILLYLGGLGPATAGVLLTVIVKDKAYQREYWQRFINPKRIGGMWYLIILGAYPLLVILIAMVMRGKIVLSEMMKDMLVTPVQLIPFVLFIFVFGPLPEELGWRGYALNELQNQMNAVTASLILGTFWAVWHFPLFFMNGTYQNEMGFGSLAFWQFCIFAVVFSIFITWVFNNNRSSTLSAAIFHFSINLTGNLFAISQNEEIARNVLLLVGALLIVAVFGRDDLCKGRNKKVFP